MDGAWPDPDQNQIALDRFPPIITRGASAERLSGPATIPAGVGNARGGNSRAIRTVILSQRSLEGKGRACSTIYGAWHGSI